jgi:hypothetical protein
LQKRAKGGDEMNDESPTALETAARRYDQSADELEAAIHHLHAAARHFRDGDVPRGCTHAFAAYGHQLTAKALLDENAVLHAAKARR